MLQPASEFQSRKDLIQVPPSVLEGDQGGYSIDLKEVGQILRRRKWIIAFTTVALLALATIFVLIVTPRYTATATVLIDPNRNNVVASSVRSDSQSASSASEDVTINSQVSLITSIAVLQRVVDNLDLARDPEFGPHPSILDPITKTIRWIRGLFGAASGLAPGQSAEDVAKAAAVDFLLNRRLT